MGDATASGFVASVPNMAQMPAQQESSDCVISSEGSFKYGATASVHIDEVFSVGSGCSRLSMLTNKLPWPFFVSAVVFVRILFSTLLRKTSKR